MLELANERGLLMRRGSAARYRDPLIVTDIEDGTIVRPVFGRICPAARIAVLATYRIPFTNGRVILGTLRLLRELEARAREIMFGFARSTGLHPSRFELLAREGGLREVLRELRSRACDLVVLALRRESLFGRIATAWLVEAILDETRCDITVFGETCRSSLQLRYELIPLGPW
jgi:hypothetical protein